jgi:3-phosphoshikimate 1-carboxyvinyltransferase
MKIRPVPRVGGRLRLPGDKSISHRAAIGAALSDGVSTITNYSDGADCRSTLNVLTKLGVKIDRRESEVVIHGVGVGGLREPNEPLDCGNSGTTMRLMAGVLAAQPFRSTLVGDTSLSARPMERVAAPLRQMGADVETTNGRPPLILGGGGLHGINVTAATASAQVKSCILLAGLFADGDTVYREPIATRDHTEIMLRRHGYQVSVDAHRVGITGGGRLRSADIAIPGDPSSAAFFILAAACLPGSTLEIVDVAANQTRNGFLDLLTEIGMQCEAVTTDAGPADEPRQDLRIQGGIENYNEPLIVDGERTASLIDELPLVAVLGTRLGGGVIVRDAGELRVKETDRIAVMAENLRRMGADVEEFADGFRVARSELRAAIIEPHGDHRIAMALSIAGLFAEGETEITDAECVAVSFPTFFDTLDSVVQS